MYPSSLGYHLDGLAFIQNHFGKESRRYYSLQAELLVAGDIAISWMDRLMAGDIATFWMDRLQGNLLILKNGALLAQETTEVQNEEKRGQVPVHVRPEPMKKEEEWQKRAVREQAAAKAETRPPRKISSIYEMEEQHERDNAAWERSKISSIDRYHGKIVYHFLWATDIYGRHIEYAMKNLHVIDYV